LRKYKYLIFSGLTPILKRILNHIIYKVICQVYSAQKKKERKWKSKYVGIHV